MKKLLLSFLFLISLFSYGQSNYYTKGKIFYNNKDYDNAIRNFEKAIKENKNDTNALFYLARSYNENYKVKKAIKIYNKLIKLDNTISDFYYNRALLYISLPNYKKALNDVKISFSLDSSQNKLNIIMGYIYSKLEMQDSAIFKYNLAILKEPNDYYAYTNRGILFREIKKYDLAERDLAKAISINPDGIRAVDELMYLFSLQNNNKKQVKEYIEEYLPNSKIPSVIIAYSYTFLMLKDYYNTTEICTQAIDSGIIDIYIYNNRGYAYIEMGEYQKGLNDLLFVYKNHKKNYVILNNIGYAYLRLGDLKNSSKYINKSLRINNKAPYTYRTRALLYLEKDNTKAACKDLIKANDFGFADIYDDEVIKLIEKHCKQ